MTDTTTTTKAYATIEQKELMDYFRRFKVKQLLSLIVYRGLVFLCNGDSHLIIGTEDDIEIEEHVKFKHPKDVVDYVRASKSGSEIAFRLERVDGDDNTIACDLTSTRLPIKTVEISTGYGSHGVLDTVIEAPNEWFISEEAVARAKRALRCTDDESTRHALSGVCFDEGYAIATDGRRMAVVSADHGSTGNVLVPGVLMEHAIKHSLMIAVGEKDGAVALTAGMVIMKPVEGLFPKWKPVRDSAFENDCHLLIMTKDLKAACDSQESAIKAGIVEDSDETGVQIKVDQGDDGYPRVTFLRPAEQGDKVVPLDHRSDCVEASLELDYRYLRDALPDTEETRLIINRDKPGERAVVVRDSEYDMVVMPKARS